MFWDKKAKLPALRAQYPADRYEPVLRRSVCTGETTACMRERGSGKLIELSLIRDRRELERFARDCGLDIEELKTVY